MTSGRGRLAAGATLLVLLLAGCTAQARDSGSAAGARGADRTGAGTDAVDGFRSPRDYQATPPPVRIIIPKIQVSSSLERLGRERNGTVEVPSFHAAGWYALGPRPGDPGSAVILGHVDTTNGPAVFFRLRELRPGDLVEVERSDGSTVRFVVRRTAQYLKKQFPTDEVYFPTLAPELRLITCGGSFDYTLHHYRSNIIVFATLQR
jgi:sortase (surface protein transpeptidase)